MQGTTKRELSVINKSEIIIVLVVVGTRNIANTIVQTVRYKVFGNKHADDWGKLFNARARMPICHALFRCYSFKFSFGMEIVGHLTGNGH